VRVLEYRLKGGEKEPMHSHPRGVVYVLSGAKLKVSYPDGRAEERAASAGETIWREPTTHAVENIGDTEAHAIAIDLEAPGQLSHCPLTSVLQPSPRLRLGRLTSDL
jgi:quercetin dioxygenase-like cupin family protein